LTTAARGPRHLPQLTGAEPQQLDQRRGRRERVGDRRRATERDRGADLAFDLGDHQLAGRDFAAAALGEAPQRSAVRGGRPPDHDRVGGVAHPSALRS
jgi:hypothetical protein